MTFYDFILKEFGIEQDTNRYSVLQNPIFKDIATYSVSAIHILNSDLIIKSEPENDQIEFENNLAE